MQYSKKVIKHFQNPRNQGKIKNADAVGQVGNPACGDIMKIYLKIAIDKKGVKIIKDIKFETLGCAAAIAVSSALTERAKGMAAEDALKIKKDDIVKDLGGLPEIKIHCSMLGIEALRQAIEKYNKSHNSKNMVKKIIKKVRKNNVENEIKSVLEKIRPSLQMDGGDVSFIGFDEKSGILKVGLMGHCAHCPMSAITLKQGIEAEIKRSVPQVKKVIAE